MTRTRTLRRGAARPLLAALFALLALGCNCDTESLPDGGELPDAPSVDAGPLAVGCGDGVRDRDTEVCDDGNTVGGDGCSADCQSDETCGNGVRDDAAGELCDDGNTDDGDGCRGDCGSDYRCGNGVVDDVASGGDEDEACDDGNTMNGDGCSAACDSDESCGNSIVDLGAGEVCDDGNTDDGDDCSADCLTSLLCGNGEIDGAEECDDGNLEPGDDCDASCRVERCGNGRVDLGEACDDGNAEDNDGCRADCEFTCADDAACADADVCNGAEVCTDAGTETSTCAAGTALDDGDACGSDLLCDGGACVMAACGDGFVTGAEDCDDENTVDGDGCDNDCSFTCAGDADCDDGNACSGTETCASPGTASSSCVAGTPLDDGDPCGGGNICNGGTCASADCGDGLVSAGEDCDDMNAVGGDGCENDCSWTCESNGDCSDGNACNGAEVCTAGGSLASRCGAGTPPGDGAPCGGGNICNGTACVMPRCGDGIVSGAEECDDTNAVAGDGCEPNCTWTCESNGDCSDGAVCNGAETCTGGGTLASRCNAGTAPATGTACDRGAGTRDICQMATQSCERSRCGDSYVDVGAAPPEQCDDGNTMGGDGCSPTCQIVAATPPTAFRVNTLRLISPRIVYNPLFSCQDITDNCATVFGGCVADSVNTQLQNSINRMASPDNGTFSLHLVNLFRPLDPSAATSPTELHTNPECTEGTGTGPDTCGPEPTMPDVVMATASNTSVGTCYMPTASDVNGAPGGTYSPTANTVGGPCFRSDFPTLTVALGDIVIPLSDAVVSATYSGGSPPTRLVSGIIEGFISSADAAALMLDIDGIGMIRLYELLQAGNVPQDGVPDGCNVGGGTHEDDRDMAAVVGFRFFLNFTGREIIWTGP